MKKVFQKHGAYLSQTLSAWGIVILFAAQLWLGFAFAHGMLSPVLDGVSRSYDDKMRLKLGSDYELLLFVQQNTPDNAVILLDGKRVAAIDTYFLYPRQLVHGQVQAFQEHLDIQYIVIDGDYPSFQVPADRLMLDDKRGLYQVTR